MTSGPSCSAARAAPRSSPPSSAPGSRISPCCAGPIYPRRLWRRWTPSFWTPGSWRAAAADGTATAICARCPRPSASASAGSFAAETTGRRIYITLGQFSIVRLERDSQLLVPVYDYCMPEKECSCGSTRRSLQPVPQHQFPCGRVFPAQHRGPPGGLRGGQELLRLLS